MNASVSALLLTQSVLLGLCLLAMLWLISRTLEILSKQVQKLNEQQMEMTREFLNRVMAGDVRTFQILNQATAPLNSEIDSEYVAMDDKSEALRHAQMTGFGTDYDDEANGELRAAFAELADAGVEFHIRDN